MLLSARLFTFIFQMKAGVRNRTIAAECQVHGVRTALYSLREFAVLEASNQGAVAIRAVVDVQEVVVWLDVEAERMEGKMFFGAEANLKVKIL